MFLRNIGTFLRNIGTFLRNIGTFMPPYKASHSMRQLSYFGSYVSNEYILTQLMTAVDLVIRT